MADGHLLDSLLHSALPTPPPRAQREKPHLRSELRRGKLVQGIASVRRDVVPGHQFEYGTLGPGEIRLLTILDGQGSEPLRGILFKRRLEDVRGSYEALSYCWGPGEQPATREMIVRNLNPAPSDRLSPARRFRQAVQDMAGTRFAIRENLHAALVGLRRRDGPVTLWVDAVCIDQTDNGRREKEGQLRMMSRVYSYASNVCVWLGASSPDGLRLARDLMNFQRLDRLVASPDARDRWLHLVRLLRAPWFGRRWIIQEIALARNATVHCGGDDDESSSMHWDDFAEAVSLILERADDLRRLLHHELLDDLETASAFVLVQTLNTICRGADSNDDTVVAGGDGPRGDGIARLADLETLVSTLLGFHSSDPRDIIYAVLSLAHDPPAAGEAWERLHGGQHINVQLSANYDYSTRDLFVAFVTRSVHRSACLDLVCRHWAPPVTDEVYGGEIRMPSWISSLRKAPFGLEGSKRGRQNADNLVAYLPHDTRKHYRACGTTVADIHMLDDLDLQEPRTRRSSLIIGSLTQSPSQSTLPSPTLEATEVQLAVQEARLDKPDPPPKPGKPKTLASRPANHVHEMSVPPVRVTKPDGQQSSPETTANTSAPRRPTRPGSVEGRHRLSGILAARGFVLGTISERSDVMRGGIVPGDWVARLGWTGRDDNRVPDALWRLLVADRAPGGARPPPWYRRACLHGLVDSRVSDAEGNLHSVTPPGRYVSDNTTRYFRRVEAVVWNKRLFEAVREEKKVNGEGPATSPLFGLAPKAAAEGDLVCILHGCTVPVVLKRLKRRGASASELFELVGEAYVHGMMDGEAVEIGHDERFFAMA